jgi:hypothetical protein
VTGMTWPLHDGRPAVEIELVVPDSLHAHGKRPLVDTGAGPDAAPFELLLDEQDCVISAHRSSHLVRLSGAFSGEFRCYIVERRVPQLDLSVVTTAVGIDRPPAGFDGIAAFGFLNRFAYGNFGRPQPFGLEQLGAD